MGEGKRLTNDAKIEVEDADLVAYIRRSILGSRKPKRKRIRNQNLKRNSPWRGGLNVTNDHGGSEFLTVDTFTDIN